MEIYNLKDRLEYLDEVATLEYEEWATNKTDNKTERIEKKKMVNGLLQKLLIIIAHLIQWLIMQIKMDI